MPIPKSHKSEYLPFSFLFLLYSFPSQIPLKSSTGFATSIKSEVISSFTHLSVTEVVEERPCLNLDSTIDFSGTVALCLQLHQPKTTLKSTVTKKLYIPKSKKPYKSQVTQSYKYEKSGFTHFLNQKNNEMCNKLNVN